MSSFEFATASRIVFGAGSARQIAAEATRHGARAFVVMGSALTRAQPVLDDLDSRGCAVAAFRTPGEPTLALAEAAIDAARGHTPDVVIAVGGGSALDLGKVVAAATPGGATLGDLLEDACERLSLSAPPLPLIAAPTTAGTGAEVTRDAVLRDPARGCKRHLRHPWLLPTLAIIDPTLAHSMPPGLTARAGFDALTQLLEAFVSSRANPLTDALCREGLWRAARSLRRAWEAGSDAAAREDMATASLLGGLALENVGPGPIYRLVDAICGRLPPAPHSAICAALLPVAAEVTARALYERAPRSRVLVRYDEAAQALTGDHSARALDGVAWLQALASGLGIASLSDHGLREGDVAAVVNASKSACDPDAHPIALNDDELSELVLCAL